MASAHPAETRFVELMVELFQLDEAEALDFGLYRIIRRHNQEVRAFLGEVTTHKDGKTLKGGQLSVLMDAAFAVAGDEAKAEDQWRIKELEEQLSIKPGMTAAERTAQLDTLEKITATALLVREYRSRIEQKTSAASVHSDRAEVLNRLYQFFARHYQDGDFIVERRYGRGGARYIRSTGEDTEFHWATEDMYYIKSGDLFTDFSLRLANGRAIVFSVEPQSLQATRAALKPGDKAHYELHTLTPTPLPRGEGLNPLSPSGRGAGGEGLLVRLQYLKGAGSDKHKDTIAEAIHAQTGGDVADIKRWLNRYIARNQADFFIHKRLKEALAEDIDVFIKTEVLNADQLLAGGDLPGRLIKTARLVRQIGLAIIDFLAALEDFQKALWEKKKLVFATRYVITLDRIEKLAGADWLEARLDTIVQAQREEWQALGLGDYPDAAAVQRGGQTDLLSEGPRYLPLPVDTGRFDEAFKWALLEAVTRNNGLDEALDGVAIHSDNWQALNTLQAKYRDKIKCIYIDPPYNTGGDGFPYKDCYQHASWISMIESRLQAAVGSLKNTGVFFGSIDSAEQMGLRMALDNVFSSSNRVEEIIWVQSFTKNQSPTYSTNHEYIQVYARDLGAVKDEISVFRINKPGAKELLAAIEEINPCYPTVIEIEQTIKRVFKSLDDKYRDEMREAGIDWNEDIENRSPYKAIKNYKGAEYRDKNGHYVDEALAAEKKAKIWVWYPTDASMPGVSAGSKKSEVSQKGHPNYRFYRPIHPATGLPCSAPPGGWRWPEKPLDGFTGSFFEKLEDNRIVWGKNETVGVLQKTFLHETMSQPAPSVMNEFSRGEKQLIQLFGKVENKGAFPNPKPSKMVFNLIHQSSGDNDIILDFFAGSGTTWQAVQDSKIHDGFLRKTILIEGANHFEMVLIPRIKKISSSTDWGKRGSGANKRGKDGLANVIDGPGLFLRVQTLEQYEDTLENLGIESDAGQQAFSFDDPAFQLRYRLDRETRKLYAGIDRFSAPFGYQLRRVEGGEAPARDVDLVESLVYLLGLDVERLYRETAGVVLTGRNRRGQAVLALFRDAGLDGSADWLQAKLAEHPAEKLYTNDPASLAFEGCDRFEAIEAVFALQFGRE